jgi:hypothetical protein
VSVPEESPPVTLRPITDAEYDAWAAASIASFAAGVAPARRLERPQRGYSREQYERVLPERQHIDGQLIWSAHHQDRPVGTPWISASSWPPWSWDGTRCGCLTRRSAGR